MRSAAGRGPRAAAPAVIAALLALPLAGLPWALGGGAHRAYQQLMTDLLAGLPPGTILTEHYDRGWFRSHASTELALGPETGTPPRSSVLQGWLDDDLVSLRDGRVASTFRLADGRLTVNGRTFPLLGLPSADRL